MGVDTDLPRGCVEHAENAVNSLPLPTLLDWSINEFFFAQQYAGSTAPHSGFPIPFPPRVSNTHQPGISAVYLRKAKRWEVQEQTLIPNFASK